MKKALSVLVCLTLALCCAVSAAETTVAGKVVMGTISVKGAFELRCALPEGYRLNTLYSDEARYIASLTAGEGKPEMSISVAAEELLYEVDRLNDLDSEALAKIEETFREEDSVEITYMETTHGTRLMVVKENQDETDFLVFYAIYRGYEIEFVLTAEGGVTDKMVAQAVHFLSEMDFVPVE